MDTKGATMIATTALNSNMCSFSCGKCIDLTLMVFTLMSLIFGVVCMVIFDNITGVGYLLSGSFSTLSLYNIRKVRTQASLQKSVHSLSEENDELKETNDDLKETNDDLSDNITRLENSSTALKDDLEMLKNTIGIMGENADDVIGKLRQIHQSLQLENDKHSLLVQNSAMLHILNIIRHFDSNVNFVLDHNEIELAKDMILKSFPQLKWETVQEQIMDNTLSAENLLKSITLTLE